MNARKCVCIGINEIAYLSTKVKITPLDIDSLEKEYRKEFYGEGQLWFFYKRLGYETFMFCPINRMTEANYRFSIPDDEIALGNIN